MLVLARLLAAVCVGGVCICVCRRAAVGGVRAARQRGMGGGEGGSKGMGRGMGIGAGTSIVAGAALLGMPDDRMRG